jgi:hypothetical protein
MGRLLILLTTLLILAMPVTEYLCNWDHFLRGGQDVEFNLLTGLLFAAMVLSMDGTMMQPILTQPVFAAMIGSCRHSVSPRVLARWGSSQRTPSLPSRSQWLEDPASVSSCGTRTPLRI